jgi:hypothetical protein
MRKLFPTAVITVLAFAIAGTSVAQAVVARDGTTGQVCSAVVLSGNTVTGGCLIENIDGTFLVAEGSQVTTSCYGSYDIRVNGDASVYYAVNQWFDCGYNINPCTDDITGETIPWPGQGASMPFCGQAGLWGPDDWAPITWAAVFGPDGEPLERYQTSTAQGVGGAHFYNSGATNEVFYSAN